MDWRDSQIIFLNDRPECVSKGRLFPRCAQILACRCKIGPLSFLFQNSRKLRFYNSRKTDRVLSVPDGSRFSPFMTLQVDTVKSALDSFFSKSATAHFRLRHHATGRADRPAEPPTIPDLSRHPVRTVCLFPPYLHIYISDRDGCP